MPVLRNSLIAVVLALGLSACAATSDPNAQPVSVTPGEIVAAERVEGLNKDGSNAALRVGTAVVGALIPGPWGRVASTASGEAGKVAISAQDSFIRYTVRLEDGALVSVDRADAKPLATGRAVNVIRMSDGTARLALATAGATGGEGPAASPETIPETRPQTPPGTSLGPTTTTPPVSAA